MAERTLDVHVRAHYGNEFNQLQKHLESLGLIANKSAGAMTTGATSVAKEHMRIAKAMQDEAAEAKRLETARIRFARSVAKEHMMIAKAMQDEAAEAKRLETAKIRLARVSGDSADKQARAEQKVRTEMERNMRKADEQSAKIASGQKSISQAIDEAADRRARAEQKIRNEIEKSSRAYTKALQDQEKAARAAHSISQMGPSTLVPGPRASVGAMESLGAMQAGSFLNSLGKGDPLAIQQAAMARLGVTAAQTGATTAKAFHQANQEARNFNGTIENSAKYLQLIKGVISAFLLYRGFSYLTGQATQFMRSLIDLQHQVGIIQTQLADTGENFRPVITQNILRIAGETGVAMEELAKAEFQVVSANIKVADSFHVLELSAKAAVAGGLKQVDLAFNAALSQANVFGESFEDIFDKQFQVIRRGIFTYEQFATVVGTLSEAFASVGQDAATANAALAAISQVFTGPQIERGATGLRQAATRLSEAPEDFQALGVAITGVNGEFRNFINIGQDLKKVLDGMTQLERAQILKKLFPDERERRGIGAFLGQLEEAEQFFVEQQFAVESLNEAYETANDSLLQQAKMFEQDLVPAMQPFVDLAGGLLGIFNGMDKMLPGLNKNLLTTATIAAVLGSSVLMSGGKLALYKNGRPLQGPVMKGGDALGSVGGRMPTGMGIFAGGLMATTSFMGGMQPGRAGAGDYVGAGISGAAMGAFMGGPAGAAIGGAVAMAAMLFGDRLGDEANPVANSFAEAFQMQLERRAGDIAEAYTAAMKMEIAGEEAIPGSMSKILKQQGFYGRKYGSDKEIDQITDMMRFGASATLDVPSVGPRPRMTGTFTGPAEIEAFLRARSIEAPLRPGGIGVSVQMPLEAQMDLIKARLDDFVNALSIIKDIGPLEAEDLKGRGITKDEHIVSMVNQAVRSIPGGLSLLGKDLSGGVSAFARALDEGTTKIDGNKLSMVDLSEAMKILYDGMDATGDVSLEAETAFLKFIGKMNDGTSQIEPTFDIMALKFQNMFAGDTELLADVFSRMGDEGEKLAEVFSSMSRTMQAFGMLQQLQGMKMAEIRSIQMPSGILPGMSTSIQVPTGNQVGILEKLGIDPVRAAELLTNRLIADLGLVKGQFSTDDFVNALLGSSAQAMQLEMSANSFADALYQASDMVRGGLMDGMGRTADELEMLGEGFQELNRFVRQKALLEELKGLAEFAGVGDKGITGAMDILRKQMVTSGKALFDLLSDPASLAELIAKMEFGDVNVDNSNQYNITVRISGDENLNTGQAVKFADAILQEINNKVRRGTS